MPAPKGRNCVQINEKKMNVSVYSILTNWTQKVPETGAGQLWICVQKVNNQGKVKVYSILTKWTQKDQEVSFTFLSTGSYENDVVLVTRLQARSVDVMIVDRETFDSYMKKGFFDEAQKYLPEGSDQETVLIRGCTEEVDDTGKVISKGEERAYGFDLSTSEKYRELGGMLEDPVLGIVVNGEHLDAANSLIEYLTE